MVLCNYFYPTMMLCFSKSTILCTSLQTKCDGKNKTKAGAYHQIESRLLSYVLLTGGFATPSAATGRSCWPVDPSQPIDNVEGTLDGLLLNVQIGNDDRIHRDLSKVEALAQCLHGPDDGPALGVVHAKDTKGMSREGVLDRVDKGHGPGVGWKRTQVHVWLH